MNEERFARMMRAIDDDLLEDAMTASVGRRLVWLRWAAVAAGCVCIVVAAAALLIPRDAAPAQHSDPPPVITMQDPDGSDADASQEIAPTTGDLAAAGYTLALPSGAESVQYSLIELSGYDAPMAQAAFMQDGQAYVCRALKTAQAEDISGLREQWIESIDWSVGQISLQLRESDGGAAWVGWYEPDSGTQWCLSTDDGGEAPMHTAHSIMQSLGLDMAVAPNGAEEIRFDVFRLEDLIVAETAFVLDGVACVYRTASTGLIEDPFADISGLTLSGAAHVSRELGWCPAELYFTEGGAGKIIWFDIAPGLLYSLTMESGATEQALLELVGALYTPAQGDAG